jgi:hypothetical protein
LEVMAVREEKTMPATVVPAAPAVADGPSLDHPQEPEQATHEADRSRVDAQPRLLRLPPLRAQRTSTPRTSAGRNEETGESEAREAAENMRVRSSQAILRTNADQAVAPLKPVTVGSAPAHAHRPIVTRLPVAHEARPVSTQPLPVPHEPLGDTGLQGPSPIFSTHGFPSDGYPRGPVYPFPPPVAAPHRGSHASRGVPPPSGYLTRVKDVQWWAPQRKRPITHYTRNGSRWGYYPTCWRQWPPCAPHCPPPIPPEFYLPVEEVESDMGSERAEPEQVQPLPPPAPDKPENGPKELSPPEQIDPKLPVVRPGYSR